MKRFLATVFVFLTAMTLLAFTPVSTQALPIEGSSGQADQLVENCIPVGSPCQISGDNSGPCCFPGVCNGFFCALAAPPSDCLNDGEDCSDASSCCNEYCALLDTSEHRVCSSCPGSGDECVRRDNPSGVHCCGDLICDLSLVPETEQLGECVYPF